MWPDFQMFVPMKSFVFQIIFYAVGALWLSASPSCWTRSVVIAGAYPLGATIAGLVQWLTFEFGIGNHAVYLWGITVVLIVLRWLSVTYNKQKKTDNMCNRSTGCQQDGDVSPWLAWLGLAIIVTAGVIGFLVTQSSDVGETDPRWQIAYRAKIVANTPGYNTPYFQQQDIVHINPKYPLAYSSVAAMTMRLMGDPMCGAALRAVSFAFFVSFLLLMMAYACRYHNIAGSLVAGLAILCVPKFWALAVDENYADIPLGIMAMTWLLLLVSSNRKGKSLALVILAIGMIGFKMEGIVLLGCIAVTVIRWGLIHHGRWHGICYSVVAACCLIVGLFAYWFGLQQVPTTAVMDNVQFSNMLFGKFVQNALYIPLIFRSFLFQHTFSVTEFGLFFPLVLAAVMIARGPFRGIVARCTILYLAIMMVPFIFTPWSSVQAHLQVTVPRILCHLLPMLTLVAAEGAGQISLSHSCSLSAVK